MKRARLLHLALLWLAWMVAAGSVSWATQDQPPNPDQPAEPPTNEAPAQPALQSPEQLQSLVAPIALYPDSLVAQILSGATYPTQIVEAERWLQQNRNLQGQDLANAVNQQPWVPSVKALTAFPSVLANLDQNLSWTQALGDAYYNQPQDVMDAVQAMRQKAEQAGNLKDTPQQVVTNNGPDIVIQPANPDIVYVPTYDPWLIYGPPIPVWPGFVFGGIWVNQPFFGFGVGINLGFWRPFGWGWPAWGFNWRGHQVFYRGAPYVARGPAFFDHRAYGARVAPGYRAPGAAYRGPAPGVRAPGYHAVEPPVGRGFGNARGQTGVRSGAFSGYAHGGVTQGYTARGASSMGGFHGGGEHGGGRR